MVRTPSIADGKEAVLDTWQGGATSKKNKNKKNKAKLAESAATNGHAVGKPVTSNGHNGAPHAETAPPRNTPVRSRGAVASERVLAVWRFMFRALNHAVVAHERSLERRARDERHVEGSVAAGRRAVDARSTADATLQCEQ